MPTPFSETNKEFSDKAHEAAKRLIYPKLFNATETQLSYEKQEDLITSERWAALDGDMAVDRIIKVTVNGLRRPLDFAVQERFRKPNFARFEDITITEWNTRTSQPSELYKLKAHLFVYGYYDADADRFVDAICVNVPSLLVSIASEGVTYTTKTNPRSGQTFLCFKFADLQSSGLVTYRMNNITVLPQVQKSITATQVDEWIKAQPWTRLIALMKYVADQIEVKAKKDKAA